MDYDPYGWTPSDKFVCWRCVQDDNYLIARLKGEGSDGNHCSYCSQPGATSLDTLLALVDAAVGSRWQDANEAPGVYSSRDGGYQFPTEDLWDVQENLLGDYIENGNLIQDILESFGSRIMAEIWDEDDEGRGDPWHSFSTFVMHRARYMFWTDSETLSNDENRWYGSSPIGALEDLGRRIHAHDMLRTLDVDAKFWRAQGHQGPELDGGPTSARLGTVPVEYAFAPNRMSAPGIPMFYGSLDKETAVAEATRHGDPRWDHATVAAFRPSRPLTVLDLGAVTVPPEPSIFMDLSDPSVEEYYDARFLEDFVESVRRPVAEKADHRGIEYVPTQVFTEFALHALGRMTEPQTHIDGILYPSAEVEDAANVVLDVVNRHCVSAPTKYATESGQLELVLDADSIAVAKRDWQVE